MRRCPLSPVVSPLSIKPSSNWKCEDCWITNADTESKCSCCSAPRPGKFVHNARDCYGHFAHEHGHSRDFHGYFSSQYHLTQRLSLRRWMPIGNVMIVGSQIRVVQTNVRRVEVPGPTSNRSSPTYNLTRGHSSGTSDDSFKNITKSQKSETWECSSCLVRNEKDQVKCVCCGAGKENKGLPQSKFNFEKNRKYFF